MATTDISRDGRGFTDALRSQTQCHTVDHDGEYYIKSLKSIQIKKDIAGKQMRRAYEELFESIKFLPLEEKRTMIEQDIVDYIKNNTFNMRNTDGGNDQGNDQGSSNLKEPRYFVSNVGTSPEITVLESPTYVSIGKHSTCDVKLPAIDTISRVMCFIIPLPDRMTDRFPNGIYVVVDIGGLDGIRMLSRTSKEPVQSSLPRCRDILICGIDEQISIRTSVGPLNISVRSKRLAECSLCDKNYRCHILCCGHNMCGECSAQWKASCIERGDPFSCPYCRKHQIREPVLRLDRDDTMVIAEDLI
jgi:hypothetical protein